MDEPLPVLRGECFVVAGPGDHPAGELHSQWWPRLPGEEGGGAEGLQQAGVQVGAGQAEAGAHREQRGLPGLLAGCCQPQAGSCKHRYLAEETWGRGGRTEHHNLHHDVLLGEGLHGADVGPGVGHVDGVDDEDPVVGGLVEDGVSVISTECEVTNSQEVQ